MISKIPNKFLTALFSIDFFNGMAALCVLNNMCVFVAKGIRALIHMYVS